MVNFQTRKRNFKISFLVHSGKRTAGLVVFEMFVLDNLDQVYNFELTHPCVLIVNFIQNHYVGDTISPNVSHRTTSTLVVPSVQSGTPFPPPSRSQYSGDSTISGTFIHKL